MDIYEHFSCHTVLPVRLQDVIDHIMETRVVDQIKIYPVSIDPAILRGFCWSHRDNADGGKRVALIGYSNRLSQEMARLTICKELLHLLDGQHESAQTKDKVSLLIDEIVLPFAAHVALPTLSDHNGELRALTVLMPACAIDELRPLLARDAISYETIALHARIPEEYVRLAFSPAWASILRIFGIRPESDGATIEQRPSRSNGIAHP